MLSFSYMSRRALISAVFLGISALLFGAGCSKSVTGFMPGKTGTQKATQGGVTINPNQGAPSFTMDEITMHATSTDCYVAINDKVYDATEYIKHMKDTKRVLDVCGKDATSVLASDLASKATGTAALGTFEIGVVEK
jgi:hypothetical protein